MTKMIEIIDVISEGYNEYYVEVTNKVESVEEFIKSKKNDEVEEGMWFVSELEDGWFCYGFEGSEYEGLFKVVVSEEEKNKLMNMNSDELGDFVDSTWR
jgi:hypothetical protein